MQNLLKRNKTMHTAAVIIMIVSAILMVYYLLGYFLIADLMANVVLFSLLSTLTIVGLTSVFVLWTPDSGGVVRKRSIWQFALLALSFTAPVITSLIIAPMYIGAILAGMAMLKLLSLIHNITFLSFNLLKLVISILWLKKCEPKARKIIILYITLIAVSLALNVTSFLDLDYEIWNAINKASIGMLLAEILLINIFTIIYTKQKYNEVKPPIIDKGY